MNISVAICAHNPKPVFMGRVVDALRHQSLGHTEWSLMLVDSGSAVPLSEEIDLSWHPNAAHIRVEEPGLMRARLAAFKANKSKLLVFCDDDNVFAPEFLSSCLEVASRYPNIGAFGAVVSCEYEEPVEAPREFIDLYSDPTGGVGDSWSNDFNHGRSNPIGAGLVLRREIVEQLKVHLTSNQHLMRLGRSGDNLLSYDDTELIRVTCELGYGKGIFSELSLLHLIDTERTKKNYILKLHEGHAFSRILFNQTASASKTESIVSALKTLRRFLAARGAFERRIILAQNRGARKATRELKKTDITSP